MKIFVNAGHAPNGIPDPGAVGPNGLRESDVTFAIAGKVASYLVAAGHDAVIFQNDDLAMMTGSSDEFGADLFVSIHCNSCDNPDVYGAETFAANGSVEGEKAAKMVQAQIIADNDTNDRGVKFANFYVLRYTAAPAILVETEFISSTEKEPIMATEAWQDKIAAAIARGITDYAAG